MSVETILIIVLIVFLLVEAVGTEGAGAVNATCSGNGKSPSGPPPLPLSIWAETRRTVSLALGVLY